MRSKLLVVSGLLAAGLGFAGSAQAQEEVRMTPFTSIDGFAVYTDLDAGGGGIDDADFGGGVRLRLGLGSLFFFQGSFQSVSIDNPDTGGGNADRTTFRLRESRIEGGLRHGFFENDRLMVFATVGEYRPEFQLDVVGDNPVSVEENGDGLIYGGGLDFELVPNLRLAASYHRADDLDNGEYFEVLGNLAYGLTSSLGAFVEYRYADFDFDNGDGVDAAQGSVDINEIRFGPRFSLGSPPAEGLF